MATPFFDISASANNTGANPKSVTCVGPSTTDRYVLGWSMVYHPTVLPTVTSATWNGVAMGFLGTFLRSDLVVRHELWGLINPNSGSHDLVFNYSSTPSNGGAVVLFYRGVVQDDPTRTYTTGMGTGTTATVNVPSVATDMVVDLVDVDGSPTLTIGASQNPTFTTSIGQRGSDEAGSAGTTAMTWTWTGSQLWMVSGIALKSVSEVVPLTGIGSTGAVGSAANSRSILIF